MYTATSEVNREGGFALIFALIVLLILTLVGLAFSMQSMVDYQISENYVSRQEALTIADAGISAARTALQASDFTTLLSTQAIMPAYDASDVPAFGSEASRNAISMRAARNAG